MSTPSGSDSAFFELLSFRFDEFDEAIEEAIEEDIKEAEGGGGRFLLFLKIISNDGKTLGQNLAELFTAGERPRFSLKFPTSVELYL